ncbi:helix-turn-helix transcriptional regulator [Rubrimonas cliftonensis]|uniref:Arabinose-binding domain of AraC transcription regulator, N-term n=1 Tax=Rubrimonas cliftonensis TaxID=89524 RepID=A0A1H4F0P7_9RHOB|nr:AraC family transcriptional regulator [Rubrimonas cliftonensis]SEA90833.1 Arabinose-binding domain of AraC transcription regulator, N-term [Rubrimonas cliftonensis]
MSKSIPCTRGFVLLALVPPFVAAGGNPRDAFAATDLPALEDLKPGHIIPASAYYALLEEMTRQLRDPEFPARAGMAIARSGLPVLLDARNNSGTIAEFLVRLQIVFRKTVTNAIYELSSDGVRAVLRLRRTGAADMSTEKVDALNAAAFVTIFRDEIEGGHLAGLTASIPDPSCMPREILDRSALMRSRHVAMEISFPAEWLVKPIRHRWRGQGHDVDRIFGEKGNLSAIGFLEERIRSRLSHGPVLLPVLAADLGTSVRQLQRALQASGTNFRQILMRQRLEMSRTLLESSDDPIRKIALDCGFASPQALARAFSNAFGRTPSTFRADAPRDRDE